MVKTEHKIQTQPAKPMMPGTAGISSSSSSSAASKNKKYKGVRMRSWGSWVSEIRAPNQKTRIWLGSYSTPEAAARAYDAALLCLKGSSANLNFPITSSHYIPDTVMSPKSIQRVAAAAANSFAENVITSNAQPAVSMSSSSSSFSSSSPYMSSSPSDLPDDDVSLAAQSFGTYNEPSIPMMDSWYNLDDLQSPKYFDQMFNGVVSFNNPPMMMMSTDDFYEGDIRLWSFAE